MGKNGTSVSIIVFEINEIDGMRAMMPLIRKEWYDELIVVDGGSTDGTIEYCKDNGYDYFIQKERGVGAALNEAVRKVSGDIIIIYAPDGSFEPEQIPIITHKIKEEGYDLVNVSRYMNRNRSHDDNIATGFANWLFTRVTSIMFPFKFTDFLYTYLGFRRDLISALDIDNGERTWGQILLLRAIKKGLKIIEIPGTEHKRIGGEVKVPKIRAGWAIVRTLIDEKLN